LLELLLPILIIVAFGGIKGILKPTVIPADLPGEYPGWSYQGQLSTGLVQNPTLQSLWTDNLPIPCGTTLGWYCMNSQRSKCPGLIAAKAQMGAAGGQYTYTLAEASANCIPRKIAVIDGSGGTTTTTTTAANALVSYGNAQVGVIPGSTLSPFNPFMFFASEAALTSCLMSSGYSINPTADCPVISSAIVVNSAAPAWDYTVRLNQTYYYYGNRYAMPSTSAPDVDYSLRTNIASPDNGRDGGQPYADAYVNGGYLSLTDFVNTFILSVTDNNGQTAYTNWNQNISFATAAYAKFPHPSVSTTGFWSSVGPYFALVLIIVLLYPLSNVIASLVREKETKLREGMMMMAMRGDSMMLSWWFNFVCLFLPLSILMAVAGSSQLFKYSNSFFIFVYFFTFFMGSTAFCVLVSCFFTKSRTASIVGSLFFFGGYFIYVGIGAGSGGVAPTRNQVMAACLHPAAALTYGTLSFADYEDASIGVTQYTFASLGKNTFSFQDVVTMMFIDAFWLSFLAWYVDKIWPSEFGTQKPWYFVFQPSFWMNEIRSYCSCFFKTRRGAHRRIISPLDADAPAEAAYVEMVTENLSSQLSAGTCVDIRDLYKEFETPQGGKKVAVNRLNLTMYSGQITALLGHNGAGKTTTIAMLTGLVPPDSGTAIIEGFDINEDLEEIRRNLGVCPQHDILFPDLTVEEHLIMFASFKGVSGAAVYDEAEKMIQSVGLTEKRHVYSKMLSGGQKRKLSVGIAFIGGSRIVFLDEPTSGMDPYSRRFTWNIIRQHREGRVIVLTTHFMDEADLLGDRVAIMGDGRLICCGSSLFLKRQYGVGYNMTVEKKSPIGFNSKLLVDTITAKVPEALVITDAGKEISFQLPFAASSSMPALFEQMDRTLDNLGIESYGISITTLEEVFIKITQSTHTNQEAEAGRKGDKKGKDKIPKPIEIRGSVNTDGDADDGAGSSWTDVEGKGDAPAFTVAFGKIPEDQHWRYFCRHFYALIVKRAQYFVRDRKAWIFTYIVPFAFMLAGMIILKETKTDYSQPTKKVTPSLYNPGIATKNLPTPYMANSPSANSISFCYLPYYGGATQCKSTNPLWFTSALSNIKGASTNPMVPVTSAVSVYNMSSYLWTNRNAYQASTFGAYSIVQAPSSATCGGNFLCTYSYVIHANFTALHALPLFSNLMADAVAKYKGSSTPSISVSLHPFDYTKAQSGVSSAYQTDTVVTFLMLAVSFVPAAMATFVVREREVKAKHQQVVSGVGIPAYWLSTFLWDQVTYMGLLFLFVIVICGPVFGNDTNSLGGGGHYKEQGCLFALLYLYGASVAGFTYLVSFCFISPATAQIAVIFINFILGLVGSIIGIILRLLPDTRDYYNNYIRYLLCLFPPFALGDGLHSLTLITFYSQLELGGQKVYSPTDWKITGLPLMMLGWEAFAYLFFTILIEYLSSIPSISGVLARIGRTLPPVEQALKDEDVINEERRVLAGDADDSTIVIKDFKKMYSTGKYAVKGVSLGIPNGECFGLLGINGAGKSTTLSMLSGEFPPTSGDATLAGLNLLTDIHTCRRKIGFCPQFDSLFELLTGREHLELYARIKGINDEDIDSVVDAKIREMGLTEYANRYAGTYSGGNKRKLSVAIAMIGEPSIVFLDEPSTGMDPVARRFMWDVITDIVTKRERCSLILTTHSMEGAFFSSLFPVATHHCT